MDTKIIAFANQKGGVGKTTTASEVAENLSQQLDKKVLLVDLDPQASLTSVKYDMHEMIADKKLNMTNVMLGDCDIEDVIVNVKNNLDLSPTTLQLSDAELNLVNTTLRELVLSKSLKKVVDNYDYVLIDCPPSRGILTVNALAASDYVIIPVQAEYQALLGMQLLKKTIKDIQGQIKPDLKVLGYVITMTSHTNHSNETSEQIQNDEFDSLIEVPRMIDVADASIANMSTFEYRKNNKAGIAYMDLTNKINKL